MSYGDELGEPDAHRDFAYRFFFNEKSLADLMLGPVGEIPRRPAVAVPADATLTEVVRAMNDAEAGHVLVLRSEKLVGIFTERDLLKNVDDLDLGAVQVQALMTPDPETLSPATPVGVALRRMALGNFRQLPVIDEDGRVEGVATVRDLVVWLTCAGG